MDFIFERVKDKNADGSLNIMYTIHGEKLFPEEELSHLDGHKGSKPVRYVRSSSSRCRIPCMDVLCSLRGFYGT